MIRLDMPQGTDEWHQARLGIPTASCFHRLLTPKGLKPSASAKGYLYELLAALAIGEPLDPGADEFMSRGTAMEPEAVKWYEFQRGVEVDPVGFCLTDDRRVGCSPDGLVGSDGGLEIKCPSAKVHVGWLLGEGSHAHRCQIQGSLWVTGRAWWDLLIYSPILPPVLTRHYPDDEWIEPFETALGVFLAEMEEARVTLLDQGIELAEPEPRRVSKHGSHPAVPPGRDICEGG